MRVATPETTAVDLVRFVRAAGNLDNVATVLAELSSLLDPRKLLAAVRLVGDVPNAKRLGYLLDHVCARHVSEPIHAWIDRQPRPSRAVAIKPPRGGRTGRSSLARACQRTRRGGSVIPQANITAWRAKAPWPDDAQVEQDLVLTRALIQVFSEPKLAGKIALRGGTALHKLFLQPACRYSEDIDLVQTEAGPIGAILDTIRSNLDSWLGKPTRSRAEGSATLVYRFDSEIPPVRPLRLKIEINTREHFTVLGFAGRQAVADNPWYTGKANITTFEIDELLATKLRAMYQRRKGRDLFDLWLGISRGLIDPYRVVSCFAEYMHREGHSVSRAQFEQNLHDKESDAAFFADIRPLLRADVEYDAATAIAQVREIIVGKLPGWSVATGWGHLDRRRWGAG